ncbi:MAG: prepilin-type N-terminal cleavage/methylation domain-containing protein [Opitutae bacterium]|nr:prepilin-type N-terminal cleavage/methylation domain-containing protein [Opitutae bacterium]
MKPPPAHRVSAPRRSLGEGGFTLLELLVAVTITLVLAGLMLRVTGSLLDFWRRSQASHTQAIAAKQVFDLLEQDLQSAVYRRDSNRWLAADIIDAPGGLANHGWLIGPGVMKPANGASLRPLPAPDASGSRRLSDARFGLSGIWLRFVATNVESGGSLPTTVAYQMARRPVTGDPVAANPAPVRYSLYRTAVSNAETFSTGYDVTAAGYASTSNNPSGAGSTTYRTARNVMNPSHANLLASNVVDFGCWLYVRNPDGSLQRIYPAVEGDSAHQAIGSSLAIDSRYPEVAEVMLRILTEEGASLLDAIEGNRLANRPPAYATDAEWWWAVVEANSRVFVRRIEIKGTAL